MIFELNMKTGGEGLSAEERLRRMDVLVAEHLFGWKWKPHYKLVTQQDFVSPEGERGIESRRNIWQFIGGQNDPRVPCYTTRPADSFKVLEWLLKHYAKQGLGYGISLVDFSPHYPKPIMCCQSCASVGIHGATIGEALCGFALRVKDVKL